MVYYLIDYVIYWAIVGTQDKPAPDAPSDSYWLVPGAGQDDD